MARTFLVGAISAALLTAVPGATAWAGCAVSAAPPSFTVSLEQPPATYRLDQTADALLAVAHGNGALGKDHRFLGLTVNHFDTRVVAAVADAPAGAGYCAHLQSAAIIVSAQPEVLVDGRFAARDCQRQAILDHENQHVAIFRAAITASVAEIESALRHATLPATIYVATEGEARGAYAEVIRQTIDPALDAARRRAQSANEDIDAPASYAAVFRRCPSW